MIAGLLLRAVLLPVLPRVVLLPWTLWQAWLAAEGEFWRVMVEELTE